MYADTPAELTVVISEIVAPEMKTLVPGNSKTHQITNT